MTASSLQGCSIREVPSELFACSVLAILNLWIAHYNLYFVHDAVQGEQNLLKYYVNEHSFSAHL